MIHPRNVDQANLRSTEVDCAAKKLPTHVGVSLYCGSATVTSFRGAFFAGFTNVPR